MCKNEPIIYVRQESWSILTQNKATKIQGESGNGIDGTRLEIRLGLRKEPTKS